MSNTFSDTFSTLFSDYPSHSADVDTYPIPNHLQIIAERGISSLKTLFITIKNKEINNKENSENNHLSNNENTRFLEYTKLWENPVFLQRIQYLSIISDFAIDTLQQQPELLLHLIQTPNQPISPPPLELENQYQWGLLLRQYRRAESCRLIWCDMLQLHSVEETLKGSSQLAEICLNTALNALYLEFNSRYGEVLNSEGVSQKLIVFGLGKLGGNELNFSSDIDLVLAYPEDGESNGKRRLSAEEYFTKLGQQLSRLLSDITVDGFCYRVDLRLRPFGNSGRIALSFSAMDFYFQREGRNWERYAWLKARAVAGDIEAGQEWLNTNLRPFIYRRYLDYTTFDGLRDIKAAIDAEVARLDYPDDIKRGVGGIREVEFLVQTLQLIRGGREPELRQTHLLSALSQLTTAGYILPETYHALNAAYLFLRRVENRLQMLGDHQTHHLPMDQISQQRLIFGLGYTDWDDFYTYLDHYRIRVNKEFNALFAKKTKNKINTDHLNHYWKLLPNNASAELLEAGGFNDAGEIHQHLVEFSRSNKVQTLSQTSLSRLNRVMPSLLGLIGKAEQPLPILQRLLQLLHSILRRSSYLALLEEQPATQIRLMDVLSRSALLTERLVRYPILFDELLDHRNAGDYPELSVIKNKCDALLAQNDTEEVLNQLNEIRQTYSFKVGIMALDQTQSALQSTQQLAELADAVVNTIMQLAYHQIAEKHGEIPDGQFAVIGYGSLGGLELSFGSDLDLVFLYSAPENAVSNGERELDASRWYLRLVQKIVALLSTITNSGRLYEVDVRLRPHGGKGLLVSSIESYYEYQKQRAWTWEHQALVRARAVAGDTALIAQFNNIRDEILSQARPAETLITEIPAMRQRMRTELDRTDHLYFDIKQGQGGLVDLEFLVQYYILLKSNQYPLLLTSSNTPQLLSYLAEQGIISIPHQKELQQAHSILLNAGLLCNLDRRSRRVKLEDSLQQAIDSINKAFLGIQ